MPRSRKRPTNGAANTQKASHQSLRLSPNGQSPPKQKPASDNVQITHRFVIDAGTGSCRGTLARGGAIVPVSVAHNGTSVPAAILLKDDGRLLVGTAAVREGSIHPSRLLRNFKTLLPTACDLPLVAGGPTPLDCYVELVCFIVDAVFKQHRDIQQLHDSRAPHFALVLAIPSKWGSVEMNRIREALETRDVHVTHFINEPSAIAEEYLREAGNTVQHGSQILVLDLGHGTFDINAVRLNAGYFDAVLGATGDDDLGSKDIDLLVGRAIAEKFAPKVLPAFANKRFDVSALTSDVTLLRLALAVAQTAVEVKEAFSLEDEVHSSINVGHDSTPITMSLAEFRAVLRPFFDRIKETLKKALRDFDATQVEHFVLAGGGSMARGFPEEAADFFGIPVERFHVMSNPSHIVANGAANAVQRQKEGAQTIPKGFTLTVEAGGSQKALVLCRPEAVIPPDGLDFAVDELSVRSDGRGPVKLIAPIGELGHGVHLPDANGQSVVSLDLVAGLGHAEVEFDQLPAGEHPVQLNVSVSRARSLRLGFILPTFPELDITYVDVGSNPAAQSVLLPLDVVSLLDTSSSIGIDNKLDTLKDAAKRVVQKLVDSSVRSAMVTFGGTAQLTYGFDATTDEILAELANLQATGGTPMAEALSIAATLLKHESRPDADKAVILVTDGQPNRKDAAATEAARLRGLGATVVTIGVGKDADHNFLAQKIADSPAKHFNAANAIEAANQFEKSINLLILNRKEA